MLVQAVEVDYDYNNSRVSAVGNVQMFYNGTSVEADKVIYDQKTKRLHAEGNIRMTDAEGKITYANIMDLSDDYRDGFVNSLRVDTADATPHGSDPRRPVQRQLHRLRKRRLYRLRALQDDPKKPPLWQVKGARIIHDQTEKMLYFENAQLEFFGVPMAYLPYFSTPDPTVKRKTGFLMPALSSYTTFGYGVEVPFYWAIAPDYDATFSPRITTRQGVLFQGEFRQRLLDGAYQIRAYGIDQLDPGAFAGQPGDRQFRGGVETKGQFALNDKWVWGWDGVLLSDYYFMSDYRLAQYKDPLGSFLSLPTEAISQLYLTGVGNRSYSTRARSTISASPVTPAPGPGRSPGHRLQQRDQQPDLRRRIQLQDELHQPDARHRGLRSDHDAGQHQRPVHDGVRRPDGADAVAMPAARHARHLHAADRRGAMAEVVHRSRRRDLDAVCDPARRRDRCLDLEPARRFELPPGRRHPGAARDADGRSRIPLSLHQRSALGLHHDRADRADHRSSQRNLRRQASQRRRTEHGVRRQQPVQVDKFSGYDRVEGGGRANVGVQATTQFDRGGTVNVLFGQSYQLFGLNSFAVADVTNTGVDSGLQNAQSDYVARVNYSPNRTYTFSVRARMDEAT